jgi:hypothetical protein
MRYAATFELWYIKLAIAGFYFSIIEHRLVIPLLQKPRGDSIKLLLYFVFCVLYFVFLCFIFCIFVFYILYFCVLYFVFYILYFIFCILYFVFYILYFCVIIMFSDVGLYRHLVIQIVIFNNNVKTWLQAIETLYFDCAKCVLHTERLFKEYYRAHY